MTDEEYEDYVKSFSTYEAMIMTALRESRWVQLRFPAYSSGAGDFIETVMDLLRAEWGLSDRGIGSDEWSWTIKNQEDEGDEV